MGGVVQALNDQLEEEDLHQKETAELRQETESQSGRSIGIIFSLEVTSLQATNTLFHVHPEKKKADSEAQACDRGAAGDKIDRLPDERLYCLRAPSLKMPNSQTAEFATTMTLRKRCTVGESR